MIFYRKKGSNQMTSHRRKQQRTKGTYVIILRTRRFISEVIDKVYAITERKKMLQQQIIFVYLYVLGGLGEMDVRIPQVIP